MRRTLATVTAVLAALMIGAGVAAVPAPATASGAASVTDGPIMCCKA